MYKPPQNSNRVKTIKNKFENIEQNSKGLEKNASKYGCRGNLNNSSKKSEENTSVCAKQVLQRQNSDPVKRNIKRTPAFRVDKNLEKSGNFQRNSFDRSTLFENKLKQFSAVKSNCDNNSNLICSEKTEIKRKQFNNLPENTVVCSNNNISKVKPILIKSKSSHDFQYIRSKFDKNKKVNNENLRLINPNSDRENQDCMNINDKLNGVDLSLLYSEPIPKALRTKTDNGDIFENELELNEEKLDTIYSTSTLKLSEKCPVRNDLNLPIQQPTVDSLTDTLRVALKRPLPSGPAPKKPPRSFVHLKLDDKANDAEKNISFLHCTKEPCKELQKKFSAKPRSGPKKADPKYMLNKLENALRNNKLRARRQPKVDISTTSGEDSDDSVLFKSKSSGKSNRTLPKLPTTPNELNDNSAFNLNCLNGLNCTNPPYEKIKEPNSSFFVGSNNEEPVYAEPYHYRKDSLGLDVKKRQGSANSRNCRNSLYYMSTSLLSEGEKFGNMSGSCDKQDEAKATSCGMNRQASAENSSLSSFTSDLDSTPSPMEEPPKIRSIIDSFESRTHLSNPQETIYGHVDNTSRVENLKNSLRRTLDRSFSIDKESDSEKNDQENKVADIITKFQTYIKSMPKYSKPKIHKDTLFYCCLIVEKVKEVVQIKFKYPPCVDIPHNIETLCFPEADSVPLDSNNTAQSYSLLITNDKGERMFGYCRRVLPEGSAHCLPLAYCILSKYRAPRFYKKILVELESRHGIKNKFRDELISQFYSQKFPKPGDSIRINLTNIEPKISKTEKREDLTDSLEFSSYVHVNKCSEYGSINRVVRKNGEKTVDQIFVNEHDIKESCTTPSFITTGEEKTELVLTLHSDLRYEDSDLKKLHELPEDILLKIFSSLLLERKVILISSVIGKLSSCVDSLESILYPFTWHHTFIPILPEALWEFVESPTPLICGVLSTEVIYHHTIENGIVVDLDTKKVLVEEGDENKILSSCMHKVWRRSIALANKAAASMDYVRSVYLSDAYLQVFILCFKDYKKFIVNGSFQKEEFIKSHRVKSIRRFLKMFTETYMFLAFLDSVLYSPENLNEFDKKIGMYGSEGSNVILDKLLEWNK